MEKVIVYDSDKAATYRTDVCGWVANGKFFGNDEDGERRAREAGCTHVLCPECGTLVEKYYPNTCCDKCRSEAHEKREVEAYNKLEKKEWDEKTPLYSDKHDEWYYDIGVLEEDILGCDGCEDRKCQTGDGYLPCREITNEDIEGMRLIIGEPVYLKEIDTDYWKDQLPDGEEFPNDFLEVLDSFNDMIRNQYPVSWEPGKFAAVIKY